jgi:hypothetical protein
MANLPEVVGGPYAGDITYVAVKDGGNGIPGFRYGGRFYPIIAGGAEGDGDGTGDGEGDGAGGDEGEDSEEEGDGKEGEGEGEKQKPAAKKTYTFSEERLKSRLARENAAAQRNLAKKLGFDSVEAMESAAKSGKESSDTEKRDLPKAESRIKELEAENRRLSGELGKNSLRMVVEREAAKMGFVDPEDAFRLGDFAEGDEFTNDGKVDAEAVREELEELAGRKKHLIKASVRRKSKDDDEEDEEEEDDEEDTRSRRNRNRERNGATDRANTGGVPARGGNGTARRASNEEALKKRFPVAYGLTKPRL